jgi:hypothetical protein
MTRVRYFMSCQRVKSTCLYDINTRLQRQPGGVAYTTVGLREAAWLQGYIRRPSANGAAVLCILML